MVIIKVDVYKGDKCVGFEKIIHADDTFSAMQKSTAFPISSVAALMAEGKFDDRIVQNRGGNLKLPHVLEYSDVIYSEFNDKLSTLLNK